MKGALRQLAFPGYELHDYVAEAIDFLREHEPIDGYFVGFSGGKDSITSLELCRMAGVKHQAFYSCTRIDPPEMYKFIRKYYPDVTWLYPKNTIFNDIQRKDPPFRTQRWCCDTLKKLPSKNHLKSRVMGIRAEESVRRAARPRVDFYAGQTVHKPIFLWPEWAVWEFIEIFKLPYPSLYDEGFHRIGCIVCPFILGTRPGAVRQREESMRRWPGIWKAYEYAVKRWFAVKFKDGLRSNQRHETPDAFWQSYLVGFEDSKFVFHCKDDDGVRFALVEADGGAWKAEAMQSIKAFMESHVPGLTVIA